MFRVILIAVTSFAMLAALAGEEGACAQKDRILVCIAHSDNEFMVSGTIAMLCDKGYPVTVVYATSGDPGPYVSGHCLKGDALRKAREAEVKTALNILGVASPPVFLHLKDGSLSGCRDEIESKFTKIFSDLKPDLVITFGPDGVIGDHEHMSISSAVTAAFDDQSSTCKALLNFAVSEKRKEALQKCLNVDYVENFFKGIDNTSINIVVDTSKYRQKRIDSFLAHNTQFNQDYLTAWVKFTADCPYEEFVISRMGGNPSSVNSIEDLLSKKRYTEPP